MQISSNIRQIVISMLVILLSVVAMLGLAGYSHKHEFKPALTPIAPPPVHVADSAIREQKVQAAMWEVAKVFGRTAGCKDVDPTLGRLVSEASLDEGVDPKVTAAVVGVESKCSPFATSNRGAIGLMQVRAEIWKDTFDFQGKVNLLNERDNVRTGTHILASYIKTYGTQDGVLHYQGTGTGTGCSTCDPTYVDKVLTLAGK